jgi:hypothetical protein
MTLELDPDLYEQLQAAPAKVRGSVKKRLITQQYERNETEKRRKDMTPIRRRRDLVRENLSKRAIEREDIHHIHSVLGLCALPYKRPPDQVREYERHYGRMTLSIEAGKLKDPVTGNFVKQGLPYGTKARLLMLHVCTRALRQKSRVIQLEDSLSAFIRSIGFHVGGGPKGPFNLFKEQLNRLAASRMQIGMWDGSHAVTINTSPISAMDVWLPLDPAEKMLWNSTIVLSGDFYESLCLHALPVDIRAVTALSHSARQIDMLLWLSYRIKELEKRYFLPWRTIQEQFCQSDNRRPQDFKRQFKADLADMEEIFGRALPLKLDDNGVWLEPCDVSSVFVPARNLLTIL